MNRDRQYSEKEIAAIFRKATEAQERTRVQLGHSGGLTLSDLKEIGREAGISPEFIEHAAAGLAYEVQKEPREKFLGLPIGVGRLIDLPRTLTDDEWGLLVMDLRETFSAQGQTSQQGSVRQWRNGNLQAVLEPTASGSRLRMKTTKGNAQSGLIAGPLMTAIGILVLVIALSMGYSDNVVLTLMVAFLVTVLTATGGTAIPLPSWAGRRERQMEDIQARVLRRMDQPTLRSAATKRREGRLDLDETEFLTIERNRPNRSMTRE